MVLKREYDFLNWISPPSSLKLTNSAARRVWIRGWQTRIAIEPVDILARIEARQENVNPEYEAVSHFHISPFDKDGARIEYGQDILLPYGSFEWAPFKKTLKIPSNTKTILLYVSGGPGTPENPGVTWFDNLKIYQDGVLIYENKFTAPIVQTAIGVVLPIATGLGVIRFGKKG